ncbi:MAG: bifunctional methionine sulfoxide reductase B/A protein [Planctomycetota bacterium]|nr:MAG: bifunctional methionine sulfoxide reductase B/A protein [Planctomycetota bacterium]
MTDTDLPRYSKSGHDVTPLTDAQVSQLAASLDPEEARVILNQGTEPAFCGDLLDNKREGVYVCRLCGLPLFASSDKFDSGTGWPSFFQPVDPDHVATREDRAYGMVRTEILCARCGAHLGHVFDDGPRPTGLRFCLNSVSLDFIEQGADIPARSRPVPAQTAYFAGGCFWGIEDRFQHTPGVIDAVSGYQGGRVPNPTYRQVCFENTGHAESVRVTYDPARVTYRDLLERFFEMHDPTQLNRQGPDVGDQYRSAIFVVGDEQRRQAEAYIAELEASGRFARPIVTQIADAQPFYEAEAYHQDYNLKHGRSCGVQP